MKKEKKGKINYWWVLLILLALGTIVRMTSDSPTNNVVNVPEIVEIDEARDESIYYDLLETFEVINTTNKTIGDNKNEER